MADDVEVINIVLANLQNAVHAVYSIYIPVIHAAIEEATDQREIIEADELNALFACIRKLYALLSLIAAERNNGTMHQNWSRADVLLKIFFLSKIYSGFIT